ncbi:hypothetical protein PE066_01845 [Ramlibacter tataouinensis]|uniref:hypothetical protein n=1 Tax=Ramlibacter tataouinensis TaxID=94132 RepID=UPI0022F3AFD7|nr:hypothetical protein [Ramlibacter tataouinensis]WBY02296.1 hypothetical protein PE066_01845 [Ramlibacter tataouinensis]
MKQGTPTAAPDRAPGPAQESGRQPAQDAGTAPAPIVERPDGYYWLADEELGEVGPFKTYEEAEADRNSAGVEATEPGETVREAQGEIGMNEWTDAETREPAEGQSPPHLDEQP